MAFIKRKGIMLCYPAEERRIKAFPITNEETKERIFFHQPKLNGERAKTEWFNLEPFLISSYGNEFKYLNKILGEIKYLSDEMSQQGMLESLPPLDGEVYVHGWCREEIDSALRRTKNRNPKVDELEYHIFDLALPGLYQWQRIRILGEIEQLIRKLGLTRLRTVPYGTCSDSTWLEHCASYCEESYEGIILRQPFGLYQEKRSMDVLKFKPTEFDEYRIRNVVEAVSIQGEPKGMVGSFEVSADDEPGNEGSTFNVGAGKIPHLERIRLWNIREQLPGKMLLVKHELLRTTNQVPIAAVAVEVL